ncbi:WcaF family extracellular polysaccharide biosynthesis acetyltransferase [Flammeovirga agarivorans]|uniref:Colanic acid biosynthesis acetyltransferase WcaF n=1 Tax=Flammeovirga agarivorans TaxID=2726742 RepID=A0A7X8XUL6_9BACT|nr:WcaF family extracellular polysaccharide biosynthesis acetyltransferase [Flammeovirga agarivorans]NLR90497.1 colanic acid biosynthesis acetyltransferase WcaF [Flammeovirga agarivorans]
MSVKVQLKNYKNSNFHRGKNKFIEVLWYFCNLLFLKNSYNPISSIKVIILRLFGAQIGNGVMIKPSVNIKFPWKLTIGNDVWIGENVWIDNLAEVVIKDNVCISQGALLLCGNHNYKRSTFDLIIGPISLEEGTWVGAKSVVCPGVTLRSHSILAVNSVANKDLEKYSIYQGNPAVKIRKRLINQ